MEVEKKSITFAPAIRKHRGVEQLVARQAHNLEVACSSPASATNNLFACQTGFFISYVQAKDVAPHPGLTVDFTCRQRAANRHSPTSTTKPSCARMTWGKIASASFFNNSSLS